MHPAGIHLRILDPQDPVRLSFQSNNILEKSRKAIKFQTNTGDLMLYFCDKQQKNPSEVINNNKIEDTLQLLSLPMEKQ